MKLLTFLGVGKYDETIYEWRGSARLARYSPVATASMLDATSLTVFLTEDAQEQVYPAFKKDLPAGMTVNEVPVALGQNQAELWSIFTAVCEAVSPGETVSFDITHGLRSFPLLGLLVAAFLRASRDVTIQHVLYGAYDVRDKSAMPTRTPIFDMTPMLSLLDWANATSRFTKTGDARDLAGLLKNASAGNQVVTNAAGLVQDVSLAAFLCQPLTLGPKSTSLIQTLSEAEPAITQQVPPYGFLNKRIADDFGAFESNHAVDVRQTLQAQLRLIHWYHSNSQLIQAMTLIREWLINAIAFKLEMGFTLDMKVRESMIARAISGLCMLKNGQPIEDVQTKQKRPFTVSDLNPTGKTIFDTWDASLRERIIAVWDSATVVRNTLDHAGHQQSPIGMKKIEKRAKDALPALDVIAKDLGIQ
jgi:CRISPR-associated DxTHG motif protein